MLLPNLQQAVVPIEKLRDYALSMNHPEGRHKAIAFKNELGIERHHAEAFRELLRASLPTAPAHRGKTTSYGDHWTTYHKIVGLNGRSRVVTVAWIFKKEQAGMPQLISCYLELS
jgi:hypothetical protein